MDPPETLPLDGLDIGSLLSEENGAIDERLFFTKKSTETVIPYGAVRSDGYRMVIEKGDTMLFDMRSDPGQKVDISASEIEMTGTLAKAYDQWFQEIREDYSPSTAIKIGFEGEEIAYLPAHEADFSGDYGGY